MSDARDPLQELRTLLRPVVATLVELRSKHERTGDLGREAERLAEIALQLIRDIGLQHLVTLPIPAGGGSEDRDCQVIDAFAAAHDGWAALINGVESLARMQLRAAKTEESVVAVGRLADLLTAAGEVTTAGGIRQLIEARKTDIAKRPERDKAAVDEFKSRYFSEQMSEIEIRTTLHECVVLVRKHGKIAAAAVMDEATTALLQSVMNLVRKMSTPSPIVSPLFTTTYLSIGTNSIDDVLSESFKKERESMFERASALRRFPHSREVLEYLADLETWADRWL